MVLHCHDLFVEFRREAIRSPEHIPLDSQANIYPVLRIIEAWCLRIDDEKLDDQPNGKCLAIGK